ncbi:HNH endonuclease [Corynebacterium amycolatum]|uniref:HNH endonuclease n=1 Tax=Corynebacterium amycolatum TaxID=43765 RepID=UPI00234C9BD7|nr:HNH endonuclease [Corynebacterium amycolatum]MDC7116146.1 HNH endonuclease [Corynebacterium amycolatum]
MRARGMCSTHYAKAWATENREKHLANVRTQGMRYRARKRGAFVENVHRDEVLNRDGWRCQICGKKIPKTAVYPDPLSPSVDHVVPLSLGGKHEMKNVQAAHLICNALKSDVGAGDQLALL